MTPSCFFVGTTLADNPIPHHFVALSHELVRRGHRVVLITPHRKTDLVDPYSNPAVYTWPSERPTHLRDARFLHGLVRRYRPRCFIANFSAASLMAFIGWELGVPHRVIWYHTLSEQIRRDGNRPRWWAPLLRLRRRLVYLVATDVVAVSEAARQDVMNNYGVPASKARVLYNTLADPAERIRRGTGLERGQTVVCVGRFFPTKGQDVLVRALALLKGACQAPRVVFVGEGPMKEHVERLAGELGVTAQCRFTGRLDHDDVLNEMASAAATAVPSRSEAFGLVVLESMAVGTPVVASAVGGIPELVRDGVEGFLVAPDDSRALAECLRRLMSDEALRAEMGARARDRFLARFEQKGAVAAQADWFETLVDARKGG